MWKGILLVFVVLGACQAAEVNEPVAEQNGALYIKRSAVWSQRHLSVCWETTGWNTEKAWVRDAVERTWQRETDLIFTGWDACHSGSSANIHVNIDDQQAHTTALGNELDGRSDGMFLNFTFQNWQADCTADGRERCIRNLAVHEFGHALGFSHEQNRGDTPSTCHDAPQGENGDATYGAWDLASVMNYCNPRHENDGVLSPTDIAGARAFYGQPMSGCRTAFPESGLKRGQSFASCNGFVTLIMQNDGNLVLYRAGGVPLWASNTAGSDADLTLMQNDGNLVVYGPGGARWASGTSGHAGAYLAVQNDGNLVVYSPSASPLWASNSLHRPVGCKLMVQGDVLEPGQSFGSCDGRFQLTMQSDGNLVLYETGRARWASNTYGSTAFAAILQADGNLVLYDRYDHAIWATGTQGNPGAYLAVQSDGNLVVYSADGRPVWASGTYDQPPPGCRLLTQDHALHRGQSLWSCGGKMHLILQADGNLVLYIEGVRPVWASNTVNSLADRAVVQADGNFVLYDANDRPLWASGTQGHAGAYAAVQNDGNLVVYAPGDVPLWASNTVMPPPEGCRNLNANHALSLGQSLRSCDGRLRLTMQADGNLVLYHDDVQPIWASNTVGSGAYAAVMQSDGNFVLYRRGDDAAVWNTGTTGLIAGRLDLQDDGNLVVYDIENAPQWASGTVLRDHGGDTCGGTTCGSRCCAAGAWCGVNNRCCTGCQPGCPC